MAGGVGLACFADEGLSRAFYFYREVAPIYAHYRWTQWRVRHLPDEMQDVHFNKLHETYKDEPLRICLKLKGFYVREIEEIEAVLLYLNPVDLSCTRR